MGQGSMLQRADEPTDFTTLFSGSRLRTRDNPFHVYDDSAAIRLLRAVSNA
jgi:hypothetical protein